MSERYVKMSERHVKVSERQFGIFFQAGCLRAMLRLLRCLGNMLRWLRDILAFFQATCLRDMLRCLGDMLRCMRDILDFLKVQYIGQLSQRVCQKIKFSFTVSPNLKNLSNTISHTVHINMSLQKPLPLEMPWDYIPQTKNFFLIRCFTREIISVSVNSVRVGRQCSALTLGPCFWPLQHVLAKDTQWETKFMSRGKRGNTFWTCKKTVPPLVGFPNRNTPHSRNSTILWNTT